MIKMLAAATTAWMALTAPSLAAAVQDQSFVEPNGERVLQLSIDIAAPPSRVWRALVDEETLRHWNAPVVRVDLRNGGEIEEGYDANAALGGPNTVHHRILTYLPERLLVLQNISTPPGLPGAEVYPGIVQVIQLEPQPGGGTRLTLSGSGYRRAPAYDRLYAFFQAHNPEYLVELKKLNEISPK